MPKRSSKPTDRSKREGAIVPQTASDDEDVHEGKNPAAVALGRLGGRKGGRARAEKLTAEQRSEIARRAAAARWHGPHDS